MNENRIREEICRIGKSLFERGHLHGSAGNISIRLDDGYLITPVDTSLGALDPARIVRLNAQLQPQGSGSERASHSAELHRRIYETSSAWDAGTRCVIHTRSTHCVALSLQPSAPELLPALTPYFVLKVGHVPRIPYHRPGDARAAEMVARAIAQYGRRGSPIRAVMLERLGPVVWHDTPTAALAVLEELEETARLWLISEPKPKPLTDGQISDLRLTSGARW